MIGGFYACPQFLSATDLEGHKNSYQLRRYLYNHDDQAMRMIYEGRPRVMSSIKTIENAILYHRLNIA